MKSIKLVITFLLLCYICPAQNEVSSKDPILMLKRFYYSHSLIWSNVATLTPKLIEKKMDSLQRAYCTEKVRKDAKSYYLTDGHDYFTNDYGIDIDAVSKMKIIKDSKHKDTYLVFYKTSFIDDSIKMVLKDVNFHVSLSFENGKYLISRVW